MRLGVPWGGSWQELLNSDAREHGGAGWGNFGGVDAAPLPMHGHRWSITATLPPLSVVFLRGRAP
jgi:1,4-alpha-glucan branching enzyme